MSKDKVESLLKRTQSVAKDSARVICPFQGQLCSRSTAKLPMEFLVNTLFPFIKTYALLPPVLLDLGLS